MEPWRMAVLASGSRSDFTDVSFRSNGALFEARVPSRELWIAVKDVLVLEEYEAYPKFKLADLPRNATVIDAGAFAGLFSIKASPFARRIVALEPSVQNYGLLTSNLSMNSVANVEARKVALAAKTGEAAFLDAGTSSAVVSDSRTDSYRVRTTSLDDLIDDVGQVDLMKLDIEGSEYETLLGTSRENLEKIDRIAAEIHFFSAEDSRKFEKLLVHLKDSRMSVSIVEKVVPTARDALTKPWRCSLVNLNGKSGFLYRTFISLVYAVAPLGRVIKSRYDEGRTCLLFASRV
jgi:FkbM family methyltransferase